MGGLIRDALRRRTSRALKPKGLDVIYLGKAFRSRLEVRWAVFWTPWSRWGYRSFHYGVGPDLYPAGPAWGLSDQLRS